MNFSNYLDQNIKNPNTLIGEWFSIKWKPDPVIGEQFNIGVAVKYNGKIYPKVLNYFERIKCLYGDTGVSQLEIATSVASEILSSQSLKSSLNQIFFEEKGFCQGESVDEILSNLFNETVPLAKKVRVQQSHSRFSSVNVEKVYSSLIKELKLITDLDYDRFTPPDPFLNLSPENDKHKLYIPFRDGKDLMGGLASAVYSDSTKIELNLLKAVRDVESARRFKNASKPAIFILTPSENVENLDKSKVDQINTTLDEFSWHMNKHGVNIGAHSEVSGLAEEISKWAFAA